TRALRTGFPPAREGRRGKEQKSKPEANEWLPACGWGYLSKTCVTHVDVLRFTLCVRPNAICFTRERPTTSVRQEASEPSPRRTSAPIAATREPRRRCERPKPDSR